MGILCLAGICSLVVLCGCGIFDPKEKEHGGGGTIVTYPPLASPALAVLNVKLAWDNRDSVRMSQIYRDDYQGTSTDLADPGSQPLTIAKSEEVSAVGGLRKDPEVTSVAVTFQDSTTWEQVRYPGDPLDWVSVVDRAFCRASHPAWSRAEASAAHRPVPLPFT